jgi:hypothetical protein
MDSFYNTITQAFPNVNRDFLINFYDRLVVIFSVRHLSSRLESSPSCKGGKTSFQQNYYLFLKRSVFLWSEVRARMDAYFILTKAIYFVAFRPNARL